MRIDELWSELESNTTLETPVSAGWITRLARPDPGCLLSVGIEASSGRRGLLLRVPCEAIPFPNRWPSCRGVELFVLRLTGDTADAATLGVVLKDRRFVDVFTALTEDLARRVMEVGAANNQVKALLGQIARWQKFMAVSAEGLSLEQQRGLYGELHVLRAYLLSTHGPTAAVAGWTAPSAAHQDFQFADGAMEVKSTVAKQPQSVRITSERQLDCTGIESLFLHVVMLDEREVEPVQGGDGQSLPMLVENIRQQLACDFAALEMFNDRLLDAGYFDTHAPRYEGRRFALRGEKTFLVGEKFPCLVERDLHVGVGNVSYDLNLSACEPFAVETSTACQTLSQK